MGKAVLTLGIHEDPESLTKIVLRELGEKGTIEDLKYDSGVGNERLQILVGVLNSLRSKGVIEYESFTKQEIQLTPEGKDIAENGSYEARVYNMIPPGDGGLSLDEISQRLQGEVRFGLGRALKLKWVKKDSNGRIVRATESIQDLPQERLIDLCSRTSWDEKEVAHLKKQKHLNLIKKSFYTVKKGPKFSLTPCEEASALTMNMLLDGSWRNQTFKSYNIDAQGCAPQCGVLHPIMEVRDNYRKLFLEMGFTEIPTDRYVELSLWNFDALFQAQDHPARDQHDTFFLKSPQKSSEFPESLAKNIKNVHEGRDYNTKGYRYNWNEEKAKELILRTHTTANTARILYQAANEINTGKLMKLFSIDKVFRNETLDATHLSEFHQMEGVISGENITFSNLVGVLKQFYNRLGLKKLKFKPAYNPYTEPSMEIFAWHNGLQRYVEVGNSGLFRREVTIPLGIDPKIKIIAWGLSTERPTMIKYDIKNIREIVGHKCDLRVIQRGPAAELGNSAGGTAA